jgi:predicted DNA-binding transcriptional regulator AlpA
MTTHESKIPKNFGLDDVSKFELLTIPETAIFLKTTRATIDKWLHVGTLPRRELTLKIGSKVYFNKAKLINFLNNKTA